MFTNMEIRRAVYLPWQGMRWPDPSHHPEFRYVSHSGRKGRRGPIASCRPCWRRAWWARLHRRARRRRRGPRGVELCHQRRPRRTCHPLISPPNRDSPKHRGPRKGSKGAKEETHRGGGGRGAPCKTMRSQFIMTTKERAVIHPL